MRLHLIDKQNYTKENIDLLRSFERNVYINAFPDKNERESMDDIISRIFGESDVVPCSYCVLSLDENGIVNGGLVADWYESCSTLEIIYIASAMESRRSGIGSSLRYNGLELIKKAIGKSINYVFLEVDIPSDNEQFSSFNSVSRLVVWDKWGAKRIPITYIQPPLSEEKDSVDNMMLMLLPDESSSNEMDFVAADGLKSFLRDFYYGLGAGDSDNLKLMEIEIDSISNGNRVELEKLFEEPYFELSNVAVTEHFQCNGLDNSLFYQDNCRLFNSFECDLMNYSNQQNRPFKTHFIKMHRCATLFMPKFYTYTSEGLTHYRLQNKNELKVKLSISVTASKSSGLLIAHLTIAPADNSTINELDMIKLITPFGSNQENFKASGPMRLSVSGKEEDAVTFDRFLAETIGGGTYSIMRDGLSRVDISRISSCRPDGRIDYKQFFEEFSMEKMPQNTLWNRALCGLILGIFDFNRMDSSEISDTVRPIVRTEESFMVLCRGHLIKVETMSDDDMSTLGSMLISAYSLIPSVAMAFNGIYLSSAAEKVRTAFHRKFNPTSGHLIQNADKILSRYYLKGIFQYSSEQEIVMTGIAQRSMEERYETLKEQISIFKSKEARASDIILECLLGVVAIFQIMSVFTSKLDWSTAFLIILLSLILIESIRWIRVKLD